MAVIGLGSMGKRRIRLLKQYIEKEGKRNGRKNEKWEITGIDLSRERCLEVEEPPSCEEPGLVNPVHFTYDLCLPHLKRKCRGPVIQGYK